MFPSFANAKDLEDVEARLRGAPDDIDLLFTRACILDMLGESEAARDGYIAVIKQQNGHVGALGNLGTLLYNAGYCNAAMLTYNEALNHDPSDVRSLVNLANALVDTNDLGAARQLYLRALAAEPDSAPAHQGLGNVLTRLGEHELAEDHRRLGFESMPVVVNPFRGEEMPVSILLLCAAYRGNIPVDVPFDDRTFMIVKLFTEFYDPDLPLPPHDVIFNGIGDADLCANALESARRLLETHGVVALNPPERVLGTGRAHMARRLQDIDGLLVPRIEELQRDELERVTDFPILMRPPGYHTGAFFEAANNRDELHGIVAQFPGERVLAIERLDARGADGVFRKYRVLCVGGTLYPIHLARSTHWKVHYFSADQTRSPEAIAEEAAFLNDMRGAIGTRAFSVLEEVVRRVRLDYFGIDFGLDGSGNVLLFEANATMRPAGAAIAALRELVLR